MSLVSVLRITTFVPTENVAKVKVAIAGAGGAEYGNYRCVFWTSSEGMEQFQPMQGSNPTQGEIGEVSNCPSTQLIFMMPNDDAKLEQVLQAIREAHPWEEPVIFVDVCRASVAAL